MSKVNKLNDLLTHMLLISNLWPDSSKVFKVKILPTAKVTYSGGKIKCHVTKNLHYGDNILTNRDGILPLDSLIDLQCLSMLSFHSWLH